MESKFVNVDGINTHYVDEGQGQTLVLIHGGHFGMFLPGGMEVWDECIKELSRTYRVVAFDKLGQGLTDLPKNDAEWTFDAVAEHAVNFLDALGISEFVPIGHSRGALLSSYLAVHVPQRVTSLGIVSSATLAGTPEGTTDMDFYNQVRASVGEEASAEEIIAAQLRAQWVGELREPWFSDRVALLAERYNSEKHQLAMHKLAELGSTYWWPSLESAKQDVRTRLTGGEFTKQIWMIWGSADRSAPLGNGVDMFHKIAAACDMTSMTVLADAGHFLYSQRLEAFLKVARRNLETTV